jgi:uncharacterized damage-inducible protein DinB
MTEIERITQQLKAAVEGEAWHGPSVKETLQGVTPEQASVRPVDGAHSIWEIVLHISGWMRVAVSRMQGIKTPQPEQGDWPELRSATAATWNQTLETMQKNYEELKTAISKLSEEDLTKPVFDIPNYNYVLLHGIIQHNLYHAGQMAMLRKALKL